MRIQISIQEYGSDSQMIFCIFHMLYKVHEKFFKVVEFGSVGPLPGDLIKPLTYVTIFKLLCLVF